MTCTLCGGPLGLLGVLGTLAHLTCRDCGMAHTCAAADLVTHTDEDETDA